MISVELSYPFLPIMASIIFDLYTSSPILWIFCSIVYNAAIRLTLLWVVFVWDQHSIRMQNCTKPIWKTYYRTAFYQLWEALFGSSSILHIPLCQLYEMRVWFFPCLFINLRNYSYRKVPNNYEDCRIPQKAYKTGNLTPGY